MRDAGFASGEEVEVVGEETIAREGGAAGTAAVPGRDAPGGVGRGRPRVRA